MSLANRVLQKGADFVGNKASKVISGLAAEGIESGARFATAEAIANGAEKISSKAMKAETKTLIKEASAAAAAKNHAAESALTFLGATADDVGREAEREIVRNAEKGAVENASKKAAENAGKKVSSGIRKNALVGGAVGSISGAGVGGITAMATGADEDNTKSMIVMGALAGGVGGAMIGGGSKMIRNKSASGSFFSQEALDAAEQMAKNGGKNGAVLNGAKGLLDNVGTKVDSIGDRVSSKITKGYIAKNASSRLGGYGIDEASEVFSNTFINEQVDNLSKEVAKRSNLIGGAAQGAVMGAMPGMVIGGVSGAIDEDETALGGALRGGLIGGVLGGIGGGVGGYVGNDAKLIGSAKRNLFSTTSAV